MRRLMLFGTALMAVFAMGVMVASSASALLPSILFLPGEPNTILIEGLVKEEANAGKLESQLVGSITAKDVHLELTALGNDTKLGKYLVLFHGVEEEKSKEPCEIKGSGFAKGDIHITGEWHLVYVALGTALMVGLLFLVPVTLIECNKEKLKFKVEGSALAKVTKLPKDEEGVTSEVGGVLKCLAGVSELKEYENEAGAKVKAGLIVTAGGEKEEGCELVKEEVVLKPTATSPAKMIKIDL